MEPAVYCQLYGLAFGSLWMEDVYKGGRGSGAYRGQTRLSLVHRSGRDGCCRSELGRLLRRLGWYML